MKPRFIFSAVAVMCAIMLATLPRLTQIPRTGAVSAAPLTADIAAAGSVAKEMAVQESAAQPVAAAAVPTVALTLPPLAADPAEQAAQPPAQPANTPVPATEPLTAIIDPFVNAGTAVANAAVDRPAEPQIAAPPELQAFTASLVNGQSETVVGFYVPNVLALPVLQQPSGDGNYISDQDGTVTQFSKPAQYGVTALLAHNFLSGRLFFRLAQGQELYVIYGDGDLERYRITGLQSYQALSPYDAQSQFVDLNVPEAPVITHGELFERVYTTENQLVLQTCIEANGEPSWGRLFILADPI